MKQGKTNNVLSREHAGHNKHPFPVIQDTTLHMDITRWLIQNQIDYILCSQKGALFSQLKKKKKKNLDCSSNQEFLFEKLRLKLKKVRKTTRPFMYNLNQISYDYTVEITNTFKGSDLVGRLFEERQTEVHYITQEGVTKTIPKENKFKKTKWLPQEALQIPEERREVKGKGEGERYIQLNGKIQRIARRNKKAFLNEQYKEIEENNRMGKTRDLFKELEIPRERFMQKWA